MSHLLGYARVSTPEQDLALQLDALDAAGCYKVFRDIASGAKTARPDLDNLLDQIRPGDTLVVWKLDRLGRSMQHLIDTVEMLRERGVHFRSLTEGIDTSTPTGKLVFHIFAALAEFERARIIERTEAGLAAARARGRHGGRRKSLTQRQVLTLYRMYDSREHTVAEIAETLGTSRATVYRELELRESQNSSGAGKA
ncbi:recombinase family protein [Microbispora rosea]|uniref:recombinase family protein n=1 Tax=Microbispora rosea TaxID=58117 RepID=UPI00055ABB6D|nr:recombinase family protein [Microbispora rosea]